MLDFCTTRALSSEGVPKPLTSHQPCVQLAILSNRTLVLPDVACEAGWMLDKGDTAACDGSAYLATKNKELFPYAALVRMRW